MSSESHPQPNYGAIFLALFFFTVIEIFVANFNLPKVYIALLLIAFALVKAALVAIFYMHLKFEKLTLTLIVLSPFIFAAILVLLVGFDIRHALHL